jgi:hypothetical protein
VAQRRIPLRFVFWAVWRPSADSWVIRSWVKLGVHRGGGRGTAEGSGRGLQIEFPSGSGADPSGPIWLLCPFTPKAGANGGPKAQPNERTSRDGNFIFWIDFRGSATEDSVAFRVLGQFATLCLLGIGWPLGGPSVAQGPPKRRARITLGLNGGRVIIYLTNQRLSGTLVSGDRHETKNSSSRHPALQR